MQFLNFTDLHIRLMDEDYIQGLVPRWILVANSTSKDYSTEISNKTLWTLSNVLVINSILENKYGMGRKLQLNPLNSFECYVSDSLYKNLKLSNNNISDKNPNITLELKLTTILKALGGFDDLLKNNKLSEKSGDKSKLFISESQLNYTNITLNKLSEMNKPKVEYNYNKNYGNFSNASEILSKDKNETSKDLKLIRSLIETFADNFDFNSLKEKFKAFSLLLPFLNIDLDPDSELNPINLLKSMPDKILEELLTMKINLTVKESIKSDSGKWPSVLGNVIAIDSQHAPEYLEKSLIIAVKNLVHYLTNSTVFDPYIESTVSSYTKDLQIEHFALTVNLLIKDKFKSYGPSRIEQRQGISRLTGKIIEKLGYDYPVKMTLPLYESLDSLQIVKVFLENIFSSVMFFLWILSVMLVYSLMLGNVEERTYEFGMLRALGFKKGNLTSMIIFQALIFSIPAIILALLACYILNFLIQYYLYTFSGLEMTNAYSISNYAMYSSIFAGISIPLISSYFPIQKALSENLKEALTIFNKKIGDISVKIVKLEQLGISPSSMLSSTILICMGFATYYLAPLSFFLMDYSIFLSILNTILIIMIVGLIFMLQLLLPKLELIVLDVIMFFTPKDRNVKFIVQKNLSGHRRRNSKTSIMFMISLSFIIFAGCTLRLISNFILNASKNFFGANIWLRQDDGKDTLNQIKISEYLDDFGLKYPNTLKNYSFISYGISQIIGGDIKFSSLCGFPQKNMDLSSVSENLIPSGYDELYMYKSYDKNLNFTKSSYGVDLISGLYLNPNTQKILEKKNLSVIYPSYEKDFSNSSITQDLLVIIPEGIRLKYSTDLENPANIIIRANGRNLNYPSKIIGLGVKIPGIPSYSSYSTIANFAPILVSNTQMKNLIDYQMMIDEGLMKKLQSLPAYTQTPDNIRKQHLLIKFYEGTPRDLRESVFFGLKNFINVDVDNTRSVFVDELIDSAKTAADILEYFFLVVGLIALILAFFLVWTSFYCNIKDNLCEYGIMRAIGVNQSQSTRVYLYEASSLILASIIIGTMVGVVISTTLVLQFNLFSELPFQSNFPIKLYLIMCVTGFVLGLLGSYYPTHQVNKLSLVKILKGIFE
jgi:ABC-type antimicrobial peptide transport system permease subunit